MSTRRPSIASAPAGSLLAAARRVAAFLPKPVKRRLGATLARLDYGWRYELRWPAPLWRAAGGAWIELGGQRLWFHDAGRRPHVWWAQHAHDGNWEQEVIGFLTQTIAPGDTVLDIGAYIGPHALLASRLVGPAGRVYAFEPDPVARALLVRNAVTNHADNVTILPWAVAEKPGPVWLQSGSLGNANSIISSSGGGVQVPAVTLSSFCEQLALSPQLIKIDVEGAEAEILTDEALGILRTARAAVVEVHEQALAARGVTLDQLMSRLERCGKSVITLESRAVGNFNVALR